MKFLRQLVLLLLLSPLGPAAQEGRARSVEDVAATRALAERAVAAGVRGILNFAPIQLRIPGEVSVQDVNVVTELEALSFDLTHPRRNGAA